MEKYIDERIGQRNFYESYLKRIDSSLTIEDIVTDNNDGVLNGNLIEFKLNINDLNTVLFQTIKYLSSLRIKGKPVPANIVLISLNTGNAYIYKSEDYLNFIEKVYIGGASKENYGFSGNRPDKILNYSENQQDEEILIETLKEKSYTKIHIDEDCIVGWANSFYRQYPKARKGDFIGDLKGKVKIIGEIRKPSKFKSYIYPYKGETNVKFEYLMDKLNDDLQKKNLGAFYTPPQYAEKSLELVREAIKRVPEGNDYVIIDRCAGTGNLEKLMSEEELSHTILSTIEYYEYKVLLEVLGDKVRHIIPPTEKEDTFDMGLVRGADALSEEYINNSILRQYVENPKCTIILFENPPYAETTSAEHQKKKASKASSLWKKSFVVEQMKKEIKGTATNDLGNAFIWSGFKYFLRQPTDSYIVYSPVKYWKAQHLINKKFIKGFAFNRKHFHAPTPACIMVAYWSNENDLETKKLELEAFDINSNGLNFEGIISVKRIYLLYSKKYYDKRYFEDQKDGILIGLNGLEKTDGKRRNVPIYNENILGYLVANTSGFDNPRLNSSLLVSGRYDGNGFYLRNDNYLEKLPMFVASRYVEYDNSWTTLSRIMKSADRYEKYEKDLKNGKLSQYLLKCLLFVCLAKQNHIRTLKGSDNRFYRNELCFDTTNGETVASKDIKILKMNNLEEKLFKQWNIILENAKQTKNYNPKITYGTFQIEEELDTYKKDELLDKNIYDYPELHGNLKTLKHLLRDYYIQELVPILFEYEFLK